MKLKNFFKECHDKEVFKKLSLYVVTSWVLIQVVTVVEGPLGLPEQSATIVILVLLLGFPINMFLVWKFHLIDLDYKKQKVNEEGELVTRKLKNSPFQKMYFSVLSIVGLLSLLAVVMIAQNKLIDTNQEIVLDGSNKIAVLQFGNNTGNADFDIISEMSADWISHKITENNVGQVISNEIIENYIASLEDENVKKETVIQNYLKPKQIVSGNFYLDEGDLLFQGSVIDGINNEQLISFKMVTCNSEKPLDCIDELTQLVLGYLSTATEKVLNLQQEAPPKYESYLDLIDAKSISEEDPRYLALLNSSIDKDSTHFEPQVLRVAYYYNQMEYHTADSLLKQINPTTRSNKRQLNLLNMYRALLNGENDDVFTYVQNEYEITPFDIVDNTSFMVVAMQFVNRPELVEDIFNEISYENLNFENCTYCEYRMYVRALSLIEEEAYSEAIQLIEALTVRLKSEFLRKTLLTAYMRKGQFSKMIQFLERIELTEPLELVQRLQFHVFKEYQLQKQEAQAKGLMSKLQQSCLEEDTNNYLPLTYFYLEEYNKASLLLEVMIKEQPTELSLYPYLAACYLKLNNEGIAEEVLARLERQNAAYQYGAVDYAMAQYYALKEEDRKVFRHLLIAVGQGANYTPGTFQNDPIFTNYSKRQEFQQILNFWD